MFDSSPGDESPDASINIDNQQDNPIFDRTPEAGLNAAAPLAAIDLNGRLLVLVCIFFYFCCLILFRFYSV